ncbi:hypothetical protein [Methylobacterium brachiatum]|uniref:hypothetical protein n=1 Tax=Methylobacterium brachiatum TaxID=269660 RepID=UPI00247AE6BF|nr:hypothetical protein [Methylobacterium brachiatum]
MLAHLVLVAMSGLLALAVLMEPQAPQALPVLQAALVLLVLWELLAPRARKD